MPQVTAALDRGTWEMLEMARIQEGLDSEWFIQQSITMALDDPSGLDWTQAQLCGKLIAGKRGEISATVSEQYDTALRGWSAEFDIGRAQLIRFLLRSYISRIPDQRSGADLDVEVINPPASKPESFKYRTDDQLRTDLNREVELSKEVLFASYVQSLEGYLDKVLSDALRDKGLLEPGQGLNWSSMDSEFDPNFSKERTLRMWRKFVADAVRQRGSFFTDVSFRTLDKECRAWIKRQSNLAGPRE